MSAADGSLQLVVVPAYYLDHSTGTVVEALPENRILADDVAGNWEAWRKEARDTYGWELLLSAPAAGTNYTRAMFRTPEDQAAMYLQNPAGATPADHGGHQAGRAVDLGLADMQATYANYNYTALAAMGAQHGFYNRLVNADEAEPWHFDDNPAAKFGSSENAIAAVGNLSTQVNAAVAAGGETPQAAAVRRYQLKNALMVGAVVSVVLVVALLIQQAGQDRERPAQQNPEPVRPVYAT